MIGKNYDLSCLNCWICIDGQSITVYSPFWFEDQGESLEQEVCSTIKNKS